MKQVFKYMIIALAAPLALTSCNDFLDLKPQSFLSPRQYLTSEECVAAYTTDLYNMFEVHGQESWGIWKNDSDTDNMAYVNPSDIFAPGFWKVPQTGGSYDFTGIYRCNYFFDNVLPEFESGNITGSEENIRHYIGEAYFFRAYQYFGKLMALGDFPIVTGVLPDELQQLTAASVRRPRNEVARFILSDLDKAIEWMKEIPPVGGVNRLSKDCARLFKSRVCLYEATWLKYFKGTAFVPGTDTWPGAAANPDFQYPSGSIDSEIEFFLAECMKESQKVADRHGLVENTGKFQRSADDAPNPYFDMFGSADLSTCSEVLLCKSYSTSEGVNSSVVEFAAAANQGYGLTKSMVDAFVMKNGLPVYAAGSGYAGDADLLKITDGRDSRAEIFIKKPGDVNLHSEGGPESFMIEPWPNVVNSTASMKYTTGYAMRKGLNFDGAQSHRGKSIVSCIIFRSAEAYLNYMEACFELNGELDGTARDYWTALRTRSKVGSYETTIQATDMTIEGESDWGAWSAGRLVDPVLFNIRRERRCELMGEGFRRADIRRWRAMDQMIEHPWHPLGINLWERTGENADFLKMNPNMIEGENVSPKEFSKYLAPYHILSNNRAFDGYHWNIALYLDPIAVQHFLITGSGDVTSSSLYQNPGWPVTAGQGAN